MLRPFHLAVPVRDLEEARVFYGQRLGLPEGRSSSHWIDFNLFGHQLVVHLDDSLKDSKGRSAENLVDGHQVPIPHFGVVLSFMEWQQLAEQVLRDISEYVRMQPVIRFQGQPGEQGTFFFTDPSGNALEFKGFRDIDAALFAK